MQINQPRVARNELPWGEPSQFSYSERVASASHDSGIKLRPAKLIAILCGFFTVAILLASLRPGFGVPVQTVPDKLIVLTFDDAVKSHRTFVAPLLKELGFGATFFVTHKWMDDRTNFMTWQDIAEINEMGFEIGNHSWTHDDFSMPRNAARLAAELFLVDRALGQAKPKVPKPISFAYCGNTFGPEAVHRLIELGYKFARRGEQPEAHYGTLEFGATYDPKHHHPLLIPATLTRIGRSSTSSKSSRGPPMGRPSCSNFTARRILPIPGCTRRLSDCESIWHI